MKSERTAFELGVGIFRATHAYTKGTVSVTGRITLPHYGECFIGGHFPDKAQAATLEIVESATRTPVASISLPITKSAQRQGTVELVSTVADEYGTVPAQRWRCLVTYKHKGKAGPYYVVSIPEIRPVNAPF